MDEQRFRARLAALDAAARIFALDSRMLSKVETRAEEFEQWLMRSEPIDAETGDADHNWTVQLCGAFERPDWFEGGPNDWNVCSGSHVDTPGTTYGWHRRVGPVGGVFATHHYVHTIDRPNRCACGGSWPCTPHVVSPETT